MTASPHNSLDSFNCRRTLEAADKTYTYFSLPEAEANGLDGVSRLPYSLKVLLENLLRHEDGQSVTADDIRATVEWLGERKSSREIAYRPARVLMQDFTGVPAVVDLAAMRDAMVALGGDPARRSTRWSRSISSSTTRCIVDDFGTPEAFWTATTSSAGIRAQQGALRPFCAGVQEAFDNFSRRAARHRHLPSGESRVPQRKRCWTKRWGRRLRRDARLSRHPGRHRQLTPPWSTASACSAGAWAASRRRPPCSASRISMLIPEVVGFELSRASCRRAPPPPTWCSP